MNILIILILTLINGIFAMSEMALSTSRKARLQNAVENGEHGAQAALDLMENPTHFLSTVQIGINLITMLNGIFGEAAFSSDVESWLLELGFGAKTASIMAIVLVVTIISYISIVFGELVPKRIGLLFPETISRWVAPPMQWLARIAKPFVVLLSASTQAVMKLIRLDKTAKQVMTEEEITAHLSEGLDAGVLEQHEHQMVHNVFYLADRPVSSLMLPRTDIEWLESVLTVEEALGAAGRSGHSSYPVCKNGLGDVQGMITVTDLLAAENPQSILSEIKKPAVFVPETLTGMELLEQFRTNSYRMVFIVDEYGVVQGLLTAYDMLEAITGELKTIESEQPWAKLEGEGSWLLDGLMPISELKTRLDIKDLPDEDRGTYNTLAGMLMSVSGDLLKQGEVVAVEGWNFTVVKLEGKRADKIRAVQG